MFYTSLRDQLEPERKSFERKCDRFAETAKIIIVLAVAIITAVMSFMEGIRYKRPLKRLAQVRK